MKSNPLIVFILGLIFVPGCTQPEIPDYSLFLYGIPFREWYLHVSETYQIPKSQPATNLGVPDTFGSEDPTVASVDKNGLITARAIGETTITMKSTSKKRELSSATRIHVVPDDVLTLGPCCIQMIPVKGGSFIMGKENYSINPARPVTVGDFRIAQYELDANICMNLARSLTNDFDLVHQVDNSDSYRHCAASGLFESFSEVIKLLNEKTGKKFRVPTEAEWEWAARGGEKSQHHLFSGSNDLDEVGMWKGNYPDEVKMKIFGDRDFGFDLDNDHVFHSLWFPSGHLFFNIFHEMGSYRPNELGLYDMSGGVSEWVSDTFPDITVLQTDLDQENKYFNYFYPGCHFTKGGCFYSAASGCAIHSREVYRFNYQDYQFSGVRLVLDGLAE